MIGNMTGSPEQKLQQLLNNSSEWCREDVVWIMEYVKKKVTDKDPSLMNLNQSRLLENFHYFAELAMMLIHQNYRFNQDVGQLRMWVEEALYGISSSSAD